jgi:hypothetical protein
MRWPTLAITEGLLDAVSAAIGRDGGERARAALAGLTLADLTELGRT